ncbi:MAG: hypothetical protein RIC19_01945 [Phaeodactylibacter sp.]|uniref:hypothetical protein n=1 Tax=Phaeodactylibacter sp. TaxID=1940289 RepID=UPI0032EE2FFC
MTSCLVLILSACSNDPPPQKAPLTDFTVSWDSTTAVVTDQVTGIIKAQQEAQLLLNVLDTIQEAPYPELKARIEQELKGLGAASEASFAFVNRWQEGATRLNQLKEEQVGTVSEQDLMPLRELEQEGQQQAKAWAAQLDTVQVLFREAKILLD